MAAGRIFLPGWQPALNADGEPIPASIYVYENKTDVLATIYADEALTTPLANPVVANSSGRFVDIWQDSEELFSISVDAPYGPAGIPFTYDDVSPSITSDTAAVILAEAAASDAVAAALAAAGSEESAETANNEAQDALAQIEAIASGSPDAPSVLNKANRDASNLTGDEPDEFRAAIGGLKTDGSDSTPDILTNLPFDDGGAGSTPLALQTALRLQPILPETYGAVGDGVADDQAALEAAIANALLTGRPIWGKGVYLSNANLANFWSVKWDGPGSVVRGSDTFYFRPTGSQTNIMYVASAGTSGNDGITSSQPTTMAAVNARIAGIGDKSQAGIWRIQLSGTITENGIRPSNWPVFANRLEIWGEAADLNSVPTAVWDGTSAGEGYAFRADHKSAVFFLHLKNIKFTNWSLGGVVVWGPHDVLTENCDADQCPIGFWYREGYVRQVYGRITNFSTWGIATQYSQAGNIGNLSGGGITFTDGAQGVEVGRNSTTYIEAGTFTNLSSVCIQVNRNSRIRTRGNNFSAAGVPGVSWSLGGIWTTDNNTGNPDIYGTLSDALPAYRAGNGIHMEIDTGPRRSVHSQSNGDLLSITTTTRTSLGNENPTFIPFRLPSYFWFSPTAAMDVEIYALIPANGGGTLELTGPGTGGTLVLGSITVPTSASSRQIVMRISVRKNGLAATYSFEASADGVAGNIAKNVSLTSNIASGIRDSTEDIMVFRLYWTSATTSAHVFRNMRTWVTA